MDQTINAPTQGRVEYLNPDGLHQNPAFTQVVVTSGAVKTLHIGMQNSVDVDGNVVGKGDIAAQTVQTLKNIDLCLQAGGAKREHIVMLRVYIVHGQSLQAGFEASKDWWRDLPHPPANTVLFVSEMTPSDYLVGIEAVAVVPD